MNVRVAPLTEYAIVGSCRILSTNTCMSVAVEAACDMVKPVVELSPLNLSLVVLLNPTAACVPRYGIYSASFIVSVPAATLSKISS